MKVWQFGTHLTDERGARVDDWSWKQTRRGLRVLARLAKPYKARSALAGVTLVGYTAVALLPPSLFNLAVDDGGEARDLNQLSLESAGYMAAASAAFAHFSLRTCYS